MSVVKRRRSDGSYSWYIQFSINGRRVTETVPGATTEKQALKFEAKRLAEIEEAKFWNIGFDPYITFEQWAEQFFRSRKHSAAEQSVISERLFVDWLNILAKSV